MTLLNSSDENLYQEISRLNSELVNMQRELAKRNVELERVQASLETRVAERTAALEQANAQLVVELQEHQRALNALHESDAKFRGFVEQTSEGIMFSDSQGIIVEWNQAMMQLTGIPRAEAVGKPSWEIQMRLMPPAMREVTSAEQMRLRAEKALSRLQHDYVAPPQEFALTTGTGESKTVLQRILPIRGEQELYFGFFFADITERKRAEQALRSSEVNAKHNNLLLTSILESPQGMVIFALDRDFRYIAFTQSHFKTMQQIWGLEIEIGMNMLDAIRDPQDRAKAKGNFERTLQGENLVLLEEYGDPAHYRTFYENRYSALHDEDGAIVGLTVFVIDVTDIKQSEDALRVSEAKYRHMFEQAVFGIFHSTPEGRFLDVNPALAKMLGYDSPQEVVDSITNIAEQVYAETTHREEIVRESETRQITHTENRYRRKDGTIWDGRLTLTRTKLADGQVLLEGFVEDITEQKHAEEQLRLLSRAIEQSPVSVVITDPSGEISYVNPRFCRSTGYTMQEVIGKNSRILKSGHTKPEEYQAMWRALAAGQAWSGEFLNRKKNGESMWEATTISPVLDANGTITHYLAVKEDITERKRVAEEMRASEERFAKAFQYAPLLMTLSALDNGKYLDVNDEFVRVSGFSREEAIGKSSIELGWLRAQDRVELVERLQKQGRVTGMELTLYAKGNRPVTCLYQGELIAVNGSTQLLSIALDITERKRIETMTRIQRDLGLRLGAAFDVTQVQHAVLDAACQVESIDAGGVYLFDVASGGLILSSHRGVSAAFVSAIEYCPPTSPRVLQVHSGKPLYFDPQSPEILRDAAFQAEGLRSMAVIPVLHEGQAVAVLNLASHSHDEIPLHVRGFLETLAAPVGNVIAHLHAEEALRASQTKNAALLNALPDLMFRVDREGLFMDYHAGDTHELAMPPDDYMGRYVGDVMSPELAALTLSHLKQVIESGETSNFEYSLSIGEATRRYEARMVPCGFDSAVTIVRDITERVRAEQELLKRTEELFAQYTLARRLAETDSPEAIFNAVTRTCVELLSGTYARLALIEEDALVVRAVYPQHHLSYDLVSGKREPLNLFQDCPPDTLSGNIVIYAEDVRSEDSSCGRLFLGKERVVRVYPLRVSEQLLGYIWLGEERDPQREMFSESQQQLARNLADQAAGAIHRVQLRAQILADAVALEEAYEETIEGWSRALDLRDKETEGHTLRVTEITLQLARAFGIPEAQLVQMRRGALLHDIGKMGIPDAILFKPGPLTEAEWEIMRRHPEYAYMLLSTIAYLAPALDIPYAHHERWDGTGYPRGLKGEEIPLAARLFAVVDVWDALLSTRPYRAALPKTSVAEYIRKQAGTHFDPQVVRVFLEMMDKK